MITDSQREIVINVLAKMLQAIDAYRGEIEIDPTDLGTSVDAQSGYQPSLDDLLKRWKTDPVGTGLRQGIEAIGRMIAPHLTKSELIDISNEASARSENAEWSSAIFNHMWDGLTTSDGFTWCA